MWTAAAKAVAKRGGALPRALTTLCLGGPDWGRAARKLLCGGGGGGGMGARRRRGGGVPEMGFRAGLFVLWKDGCWCQRRRNTNFGPENFFSRKSFPPHMCSQNDQRDVGIVLSHVCWGRTPPPPARQVGQRKPKPPSRHGDQGVRGGGMGKWASVPSPPLQSNVLAAKGPCRHPSGRLEFERSLLRRPRLSPPVPPPLRAAAEHRVLSGSRPPGTRPPLRSSVGRRAPGALCGPTPRGGLTCCCARALVRPHHSLPALFWCGRARVRCQRRVFVWGWGLISYAMEMELQCQ